MTFDADKPSEIKLPSAHEEMLGIFLRDQTGKLFTEYKSRLQPDLFQEYQWLFDLLNEVEKIEPPTFRAVAVRARDKVETLQALRGCAGTVARIPELITKLKKQALGEKLRNVGRRLYTEASLDEVDTDELLRELQQQIFSLQTSEIEDAPDPERDVEQWFEWINEIMDDPRKAFGLMTGHTDMDRLTTGFHRSDFVVVGARTSIGKSAFEIDVILRLTQAGHKCALFSLEMNKRQIYNRMLANLMGINYETLRTGQLAKELRPKMEPWKDFLKQIYVDDRRGVSADYIVDSMRHLKRTQGLDFVAVDYLQDVKEKGESNDNSGSAIARICRKLRAGAQECDCVMMGLSQVSRDVENRQDKRPTIADLSGSTGIETAADVIALLYRDEYYKPDTDRKGIMEVNFSKQRNGKVGKVELVYDTDRQRLNDISRR